MTDLTGNPRSTVLPPTLKSQTGKQNAVIDAVVVVLILAVVASLVIFAVVAIIV